MSIFSLVGRSVADLIKMGYPESVAKRISSGELPMDEASRMSRAREQGFDVDEVFYHGTPAAQSIADEGFDPARLGKGNDQMGAGFYFTNNPNQASGYAHGDNAGIIPVYLRTGKSQEIDFGGPAGFGIEADSDMAFELLKRAPEIRESYGPMSNFFEAGNPSGYTDDEIRDVADLLAGSDVDIIQGDMFPHAADKFLGALTDVTGIDSIVTRADEATDPTVRTVFSPSQVRSPNAAFDPEYTGRNIMGGVSGIGAAGLLSAISDDAAASSSDNGLRPVELTDEQRAALYGPSTIEQIGSGLVDSFAEAGSALGEGVVGGVDFMTADIPNFLLDLIGSDVPRAVRIGDIPEVQRHTQGGHMDNGLGRDVIRAGFGMLSPI